MSNEEKKEPVIASYELTAAHKEEDDISESEVNDMINESEDDPRPANESRLATHPFLHFLYQNLLWLVICIVIFIICILASSLYFRVQDKKSLNSVSSHEISQINLDLASNLTLMDKVNIVNTACYYTDLNFDYTDKHSYAEIHDVTVNELTSYFSDIFSCKFTENGIYEMYISKSLATSNENSYKSFTIWIVRINYFGFNLNCFLDYDTNKLISLDLDMNPDSNSFYNLENLIELDYYYDYIVPIYTFLGQHAYNSSATGHAAAHNFYVEVVSQYYGLASDNVTPDNGNLDVEEMSEDDISTYEYVASDMLPNSKYYTYTDSFSLTMDDDSATYSMYMKSGLFTFQMNRYYNN